jgi:hypothetical protein
MGKKPKVGNRILWTHPGLGDQICNARIIETFVEHHPGDRILLPTKRKYKKQVSQIYSYLKGVKPIPVPNNPRLEILVIWGYQLLFGAGLQVVGRWKLNRVRNPKNGVHLSLSSRFNVTVGLHPKDLVSSRLREHLLAGKQVIPPEAPFAFIDTHPGTHREVPQTVIDSIQARGLDLVFNDNSVPLHELCLLIDSAQELHMVGSAPLCLALTIGSQNPVKIYYAHDGEDLSYSYPSWITVAKKIHD